MKNKLFDHNNNRDTGIFFFCLLVVGLYYLYLNLMIPLFRDDYIYSMVYGTTRRVSSFGDLVESQVRHYKTWGGRTVIHSIVQWALMGNVGLFRVINTLVFVLLNLLLSQLALGSSLHHKRPLWQVFLCSATLIWLLVPSLGETTLWLTGSINYLWNFFFVMIFLELSQRLRQRRGRLSLLIPAHILMGILAGWGFETTSLTGLVLVIAFQIVLTEKIPFDKASLLKLLPGISAYLTGYLLLVFAPGNAIRALRLEDPSFLTAENTVDKGRNFLSTVVDNLPRYIELQALLGFLFLILLFFFTLVFLKKRKQEWKINKSALLFVLAGLMNNALILAIPNPPTRTNFGSAVFFIAAILSLFSEKRLMGRTLSTVFLTLLTVISLIIAVPVGMKYQKMGATNTQREAITAHALAEGHRTIEWPLPYLSVDKGIFQRIFERIYNGDILPDSTYWENKLVAEYYGFDEVLGEQPDLFLYPQSTVFSRPDWKFEHSRLLSLSKISREKSQIIFFQWEFGQKRDFSSGTFIDFKYRTKNMPLWQEALLQIVPDAKKPNFWKKQDFGSRALVEGDSRILSVTIPGKEDITAFRVGINRESGSFLWKAE